MAGPVLSGKLESWHYYDVINSGVNLIAPYQCVSPLTAAQIAGQAGAKEGESCRPGEAYNNGVSTINERVIGVSEHGAKHDTTLAVRVEGLAHIMAGAAIAYGSMVFCGLAEQRTNSQAPLINLFEANLPVEPGVGITYNLSMIDDIAPTLSTSGSTTLHLPVGYALEAAGAKYELIRVSLQQAAFYA